MNAVQSAEKLDVPVTEVWRGFLCDMWNSNVGAESRPEGTIQFEVQPDEGGPSTFFFVTLTEVDAVSRRGLSMDSLAWVETRESSVRELLEGQPPKRPLTVTGDQDLVHDAFDSLQSQATTSLFAARLAK